VANIKTYIEGPGGIKEMMSIALPMIISSGCDMVMSTTDRMFLSWIDPEIMNAAMTGGISALALFFFFFGIINFSTALVAQYLGAKQKRYTAWVTTQAIIIAILSYPIIILLKPLGTLLFDYMNLPEKQLEHQIKYFNILVYGGIATLLRTAMSCFFSGIGRTKIVMIATIISMLANVAINYVLIFGKLGFPKMGIEGAAIGTITANAIAVIILFAEYFKHSNRLEFSVHKSFQFSKVIMKKLLYFGLPLGIEMFITMLAFNILLLIFQAQGNVISTATTITFNWDFIAFVPLLGIEVAVTSLVGRYMGAKDPDTAHRSTMSAIYIGFIYCFINLILYVAMPHSLVQLFSPNQASDVFIKATPIAVRMIQLASLYVLFDAIMICLIGALRGAGDTHWTMRISIAMHWGLVAVAYIFFEILHFSVISTWVAVIAVILLFTIVLFVRYRKGKWKTLQVI